MNVLQSLSASGVHAMRCAVVPCEKEGTGEIVADSKVSDTHHRAKGIGRSIELFWISMFIIALASIVDADIRHHHHGRQEYALAEARACSEASAFGAFDLATLFLLPIRADFSPAWRSELQPSSPAQVAGFKGERHKPSYRSATSFGCLTVYLRSIEPLIAIVLS
jgi:hypothetical protein